MVTLEQSGRNFDKKQLEKTIFPLIFPRMKIRSGHGSRSRDLAVDEMLGSGISFSLFHGQMGIV